MNLGGYFDYNATTPLTDNVREAMTDAMLRFENPSASYAPAGGAKSIMDAARRSVAKLIGAEPEQIVFTSGATESNNWVLSSLLSNAPKSHALVTTAIEHDATLAAGEAICTASGRPMHIVRPDATGIVSPDSIATACAALGDVALVSAMRANNETGAILPTAAIGQVAAAHGAFFHVDAVQAVGKLGTDVKALGCDALSLSAHKFHGPKGIGALFLKDPDALAPMILGGGQERGLRAGTENIVGIAGLGAAAEEACRELDERIHHATALRQQLLGALDAERIGYVLNGPSDVFEVVPNTVNISIPGIRAEALVMRLGLKKGIALSLGSACSTNKDRRHSHVLMAMGLSEERLAGAMRISFGKYTSPEDVSRLVRELADALKTIQSLAAAE